MDLSTTAFASYVAGLYPYTIDAPAIAAVELTSQALAHTDLVSRLITGQAPRYSDKQLTHYFGLYGEVKTGAGLYGSFMSIRHRDSVLTPTRWVTTMNAGLQTRAAVTHQSMATIDNVADAVVNALMYRIRSGDERVLKDFELSLYSFLVPKTVQTQQIEVETPPRSTATPTTPMVWHC